MFYKILFAVTIIAEFVTVPLFLKYYWPQKCVKSLTFKMASAVLFVLCGFSAMKISANNTSYAMLIIIGLVLGMVGDFFLHSLKNKMIHFIIGVVAFLVGHIFYISAFYHAQKTLRPQSALFSWYEVVAVAVIVIACLVFAFAKDLVKKKGPMVIGCIVYAAILTEMVLKAILYIFAELNYGINDSMIPAVITVGVGSVFFLLSDASLGIILIGDETKRGMRIFNIITYFVAQILLASSILFIRSQIIL